MRGQRLDDEREPVAVALRPDAQQPVAAVHDPHRAEPSLLQEGQSPFIHARGPAARGGERGERQLGLALFLAGAERRAQRLGAVAAQDELARVARRADHEHAPLLDLDAPSDRVCGSAGRHAA